MGKILDHARRELEIAGMFREESDYGGTIGEAVLQIVRAFEQQPHSGFSAHLTLDVFNKVAMFRPLTPLTNDPNEWNEVGEGIWQSQRRSDAFSLDGGLHYYTLEETTCRADCSKCSFAWEGASREKLEGDDVTCHCGAPMILTRPGFARDDPRALHESVRRQS